MEQAIAQPVSGTENSLPPDEAWKKFLKSRNAGEASSFLSLLPQAPETGARATTPSDYTPAGTPAQNER
ncbi:hypothetical protein OPIT5_23610 [Opitutaceae bacterium TAV5]|nr:hypothetical protein OPIT5_23610 [Opitutaceae bacterium TAV5]